MFFFRPCPGEPGKVLYQIPFRLFSSTGRKGINQMQSFCDGRQFLNGVGIVSFMMQPFSCIQIQRETTQRTLGKRRFFVLLFLEVEYINHILYVYRFIYYILYIIYIQCFLFVLFPYSFMVSIFCGRISQIIMAKTSKFSKL